jgi:transcriptional regulator with PAS, ATPase and Fis domain
MEDLVGRLRQIQGLANLVGGAPAFLRALRQLPAIAKSGATVVISGETGTGKELVARAIHYLSERAGLPFVAVNCGSYPESLLEAELFGYERGAFTGAQARREGLIAQAEGGTLFLDEVDTLPPKAQVDLLRVLQEKSFRVLGCGVERRADVRVLGATNASLDRLVRLGSFRTDLYYRLCIFSISLPPLRDRKEDILPLATHFLESHTPTGMTALKLDSSAREALLSYDWPGNVRELENAIIRGIYLSQTDSIDKESLGLSLPTLASVCFRGSSSFKAAKRELVEEFEKNYLSRIMIEHRGNVTRAAHSIGKERRDLGKLLKKYQLNPKLYRLQAAIPSR